MADWTPLRTLLADVDTDLTLTWSALDRLVGGLPNSAYVHSTFWKGSRSGWPGFTTSTVKMNNSVTFVRINDSPDEAPPPAMRPHPELRRELAVWRAATGVAEDERTMAGPMPHDDREAAYHRSLSNRINARYGEAINVWADRIIEYVGKRDQQTGELAKYLDQLARKGSDAERILDLAASRKPLPVDHPTAALAYRVKDLATPRKQRRAAPAIDPFPRSPQHDTRPSLGL